jgi:hypothetical protein
MDLSQQSLEVVGLKFMESLYSLKKALAFEVISMWRIILMPNRKKQTSECVLSYFSFSAFVFL